MASTDPVDHPTDPVPLDDGEDTGGTGVFEPGSVVVDPTPETDGVIPEWIPFRDREEFRLDAPEYGPGDPRYGVYQNPTPFQQMAISQRISILNNLLSVAGGNPNNMIGALDFVVQSYGLEVAEDFFGYSWDQTLNNGQGDWSTTGSEAKYSEQGFRMTSGSFSNFGEVDRMGALNAFANTTNFEAQAAYNSLNDEERNSLKELFWSAGYYGDGRPTFSSNSPDDRAAFNVFIADQLANPDLDMMQVVREAEGRQLERLAWNSDESALQEVLAERRSRQNRVIPVSDPATISEVLSNFSQSELGMGFSQEIYDQYASRAVAGEKANKQAFFDAVDAVDDSQMSGIPVEEIDLFLNAIQQVNSDVLPDNYIPREDNGTGFRFSNEAWTRIAPRLGLDPNDLSRETQQLAARVMAANLYTQSNQSWGETAQRWRAQVQKRNRTDVGPSQRWVLGSDGLLPTADPETYSQNVRRAMIDGEASFMEARGQAQTGSTQFVEGFDTAANAKREFLAAYKTEQQTWQMAQRGAEFFRLIGEGSRLT